MNQVKTVSISAPRPAFMRDCPKQQHRLPGCNSRWQRFKANASGTMNIPHPQGVDAKKEQTTSREEVTYFETPSCLLDAKVEDVIDNMTATKALRKAVQGNPSLRDDLTSLANRAWMWSPISSVIRNPELVYLLEHDPEFRCDLQALLYSIDKNVSEDDIVWLVDVLYRISVHPVIYSIVDLLEQLMSADRLESVDDAIQQGLSSERLNTVVKFLSRIPPRSFGKFMGSCKLFWTETRVNMLLDFLDRQFAVNPDLATEIASTLDNFLLGNSNNDFTQEDADLEAHYSSALTALSIFSHQGSNEDQLTAMATMFDAALQAPDDVIFAMKRASESEYLQHNHQTLAAAGLVLMQPSMMPLLLDILPACMQMLQESPENPSRKPADASRLQLYMESLSKASPDDLHKFIVCMADLVLHLHHVGFWDIAAGFTTIPFQKVQLAEKAFMLVDAFVLEPGMLPLVSDMLAHMPKYRPAKMLDELKLVQRNEIARAPALTRMTMALDRFSLVALFSIWLALPRCAAKACLQALSHAFLARTSKASSLEKVINSMNC